MTPLAGVMHMYITILDKKKMECSKLLVINSVHKTTNYTFKNVSQIKNFSWQNNGSEGDLGWTLVIILKALFCKINRGSLLVLQEDPQTCLQYITKGYINEQDKLWETHFEELFSP